MIYHAVQITPKHLEVPNAIMSYPKHFQCSLSKSNEAN